MARSDKQVRGKLLVARVMAATIAELARTGMDGLSIEDVAARADVNKTSIYRRWPTPQVLAREALACATAASPGAIDTGSLRGDVAQWAREFQRVARSPDMQTIIRLRFGAHGGGRVRALSNELAEKKHARSRAMLLRAVQRGELPPDTDTDLVHEVMFGAMLYLVVFAPEPCDEERLERALLLILDGVAPPPGPRRRVPRAAAPHARNRRKADIKATK
jgi:AcrR family transcriptional regulator